MVKALGIIIEDVLKEDLKRKLINGCPYYSLRRELIKAVPIFPHQMLKRK
jgi:hypothetical protein